MKTFILTIIFLYNTHVFCCEFNNVSDVYSLQCPLYKWHRRKRAYTYWRSDLDTTPEFIVKVLDEEITTINPLNVVAVNIQPVTKSSEKVIVGVPIFPKPAGNKDVEDVYSRFEPPTTVSVARLDGSYMAQVPNILIEKLNEIRPKVPNPHRDESPPAAPRFLPKKLSALRQFAPVGSDTFHRPEDSEHITPSHTFKYDTVFKMTDKLASDDHEPVPFDRRTESHRSDLNNNDNFNEDHMNENDNEFAVSRTSLDSLPLRTSLQYDMEKYLSRTPPFAISFTSQMIDDDSKSTTKRRDSDTYNLWFYNDDYSENNDKKGAAAVEEKETNILDNRVNDLREESRDYEYLDTSINRNVNESLNMRKSYEEVLSQTTLKDELGNIPKRVCNMIKIRPLSFNSPLSLPEILTRLKKWAEESPVAKWVDITNSNVTTMENSIYMMIVDDPSNGQVASAKQTVMIVAGIQGRDHHSVTAAMYVLYQLIEKSSSHADLLTKYRFWIIPVFNPDGYEYSITFPHVMSVEEAREVCEVACLTLCLPQRENGVKKRDWSKNLRQNWEECKGRKYCTLCDMYGLRCSPQSCFGVHLDRNFEYQWIPRDDLRIEHACGTLYAGPRQLSEIETLALTSFLHQKQANLYTFIAFKEGDVLGVMYPYSHTRKRRARDSSYRHRASRAAAAAYRINGRPYVAGQTSEFLPLYAGGIEDWVEGHLGIDNTYTIMLYRPSDSYNKKLSTERVIQEAYAAMDTLLMQSTDIPKSPTLKLVRINRSTRTDSTFFLLTFLIIMLQVATVA